MSTKQNVQSIYINSTNANEHLAALEALSANWPTRLREQIGNEDGVIYLEAADLQQIRLTLWEPLTDYATPTEGGFSKLSMRVGFSSVVKDGIANRGQKGDDFNFKLQGLATFHSVSTEGETRNIQDAATLLNWVSIHQKHQLDKDKNPKLKLWAEGNQPNSRVAFFLVLKKNVAFKVRDAQGRLQVQPDGTYVTELRDTLEASCVTLVNCSVSGNVKGRSMSSNVANGERKLGVFAK